MQCSTVKKRSAVSGQRSAVSDQRSAVSALCAGLALWAGPFVTVKEALAQTVVHTTGQYQSALSDAHIRIAQDITLTPVPDLYTCTAPGITLDAQSGVLRTLTSDGGLGRALVTSGSVTTVKNLGFSGFQRVATNEKGGALYIGGDVIGGMSNVAFQDNSTVAGGGGFAVEGEFRGDLTNAVFANNTTGVHGGGFRVEQDFKGDIRGSQFTGNQARNTALDVAANGGGIFIGHAYEKGGVFTADWGLKGGIYDTTFTNNHTSATNSQNGYGGGLYVGRDIAQGIHRTTFTGNTAMGTAPLTSGKGGGFYTRRLAGGVNDSTFTGNAAFSHGGGFALEGLLTEGVNGSQFVANQAGQWGGGFFTVSLEGGVSDSTFTQNRGLHGGGFGVSGNAAGGFYRLTFNNNTASGAGGGFIVNGTLSGGLGASDFTNNQAVAGGGLYIGQNLLGGLQSSSFTRNTATSGSGGGVCVVNTLSGGLYDSTFSFNTALARSGGGLYAANLTGGVVLGTFTSNRASWGGAMYIENALAGGVDASAFLNNRATNAGGALYAKTLSNGITDTAFTRNEAGTSGGGVFVENLTGGVKGSLFTANKAGWGGGLYTWLTLVGGIHDTRFSRNEASDSGGGAYLVTLNGGVHRSTFSSNQAANAGGALYLWNPLVGGINESRFVENRATLGGAVFARNSVDTITGSRFIANSAQGTTGATAAQGYGGAAVLSQNTTVANSVFLANSARTANAADALGGSGGAIFHQQTTTLAGSLTLAASGGGRTIFYGNTHNQGAGGERANALHFANTASPANTTTVNVNVAANGAAGAWGGRVLMFDGMSSQADGLVNLGTSYGNVRTTVNKTGTNDWVLGGVSELRGVSVWNVNTGTLKLTQVDGTGPVVGLHHTASAFNLANGAALVGSGTVVAPGSVLKGTLAPSIWRNTGTQATAITSTITEAEIDSIDVAEDSIYGTLRFEGDVSLQGARYEVDLDYNNGAPKTDLVEVIGKVTSDAADNIINVTGLTFTGPIDFDGNTFQHGELEPFATVMTATDGIHGQELNLRIANRAVNEVDFAQAYGKVDTASDGSAAYKIGVGLSWYSNVQDATGAEKAHGTFTLDAPGSVFTLNGILAPRPTTNPNWDGNSLTKRGSGMLVLNGANTYTGLTRVESGTLRLGGSYAAGVNAKISGDVEVYNGATLGGHGTVLGHVNLRSGATFAPGSSVGTFTTGSFNYQTGSWYDVEVRPNTADATTGLWADLHKATGLVTIDDGAQLRVLSEVVSGAPAHDWSTFVSRDYLIIDAPAGVILGSADPFVVTKLAFLDHVVTYTDPITGTPTQVWLRLSRNSKTTDDYCETHNQCETGGALPDPVDNALTPLTPEEVREALNNLSGEIYASTRAALLDNRYLRDALDRRMLANRLAPSEGMPTNEPMWIATWGFEGKHRGNRNVARIDQSGMGFVFGGDRRVNNTFFAGWGLSHEITTIKSRQHRNSQTEAYTYTATGYLATRLGETSQAPQLRAGMAYSYLDLSTERRIRAGTLQGTLESRSKGHKVQLFGEAAREIALTDRATATPYLNLAYIWLRTGQATEHDRSGGNAHAAALHVRSQTDHLLQTTLGLRANWQLDRPTPVTLTANLGWVHDFGDTQGRTTNRFVQGTRNFDIRGTKVDQNRLLVGLGAAVQLTAKVAVTVGYQGQFASRSRRNEHSGNLQFKMYF